jgi:hypothetical protein
MRGPLYPSEGHLVLTVQETVWVPGPVWMGTEISASLGFDPQTIQHVASCYTDGATVAHYINGMSV